MKVWSVQKLDKERAEEISQCFDIPVFTAMLLALRNIDIEDTEEFLSDDVELYDPLIIEDMDLAAERILQAAAQKEKICVYGDYDADGVTATALLYSHLKYLNADVIYEIPSREEEGYGLNIEAIKLLGEKGVKLIVTVDNGISAVNEIEFANSIGIDVVVTDHHMPPPTLPVAVANVDPHRADCMSIFKELSGVGVAFKLVMALSPDIELSSLLDMYSELVCIGTVGDIVSLTGENRELVKAGLSRLAGSKRKGIQALKDISGLNGKPVTASSVAFALVPRINAVGRLENSKKSVELLLTDDMSEASATAALLDEQNKMRQSIEHEIFLQAVKIIEANKKIKHSKVIVIDSEGWHAGVIGIVASRLKEMYSKPVIVIARDGELAKGSGRSINGFSLCDAVFACSEYLDKYGGHSMAAGLSMHSDNIEAFRAAINDYADKEDVMPYNMLTVDCKLNPASLDIEVVGQIKLLEPFGAGNPSPIFGLYNMRINKITPVSMNKHLRLNLERDGTELTAMLFGTSSEAFPYREGDTVDTAVVLDIEEYRGNSSLSIVIKGCKLSSENQRECINTYRVYEKFMRGERLTISEINVLMPTRDEFILVYRYINKVKSWRYPIDILTTRINDDTVNCGRLAFILRCMRQLKLIRLEEQGDICMIDIIETKNKVELDEAKALIYLKKMLQETIKGGKN